MANMLDNWLPITTKTTFLDMNGTFMFGHDRFDGEQDFYRAYQAYGGCQLERDAVNRAVRRVVDRLEEIYDSDSHDSQFPSVGAVARNVLGSGVDERDIRSIEGAIASHELGHVSELDARALTALSKRFSLFVVSNLWSRSQPWKVYLSTRLGTSVFSGWVFSSDIGVNKPAREIFDQALALAEVDASDVVMVGDDVERDIRPAAELGMKTIWLSKDGHGAGIADRVISGLDQLL